MAKSFAIHTEALEFYLNQKDQATGGSVAKRKEAEKLTFAAFLEHYYNEYGTLKRGRREEQNRGKRLSQESFAAKKLLEVATHDFAAFIRWRREGGASDPTIRRAKRPWQRPSSARHPLTSGPRAESRWTKTVQPQILAAKARSA